jgi:hypothetical protein
VLPRCVAIGVFILFTVPAELLLITVVNRQDQSQEYDYVVSSYNSWLKIATTTGQHFTLHRQPLTLELTDERLAGPNYYSKGSVATVKSRAREMANYFSSVMWRG